MILLPKDKPRQPQIEGTGASVQTAATRWGARPPGKYGGDPAAERHGDGQTVPGSYVRNSWHHRVNHTANLFLDSLQRDFKKNERGDLIMPLWDPV